MAWKDYKRVKVAPRVYMNIKKGEVSNTLGVRGASITFGNAGEYVNTGIPGTGYYNRQQIIKGSHKTPRAPFRLPMPKSKIRPKVLLIFALGSIISFIIFIAVTNPLWLIVSVLSAVPGFVIGLNTNNGPSERDVQKVYLEEAKSAIEYNPDSTCVKILGCFINSYEILDLIDDEAQIIEKLNVKPVKNADKIAVHEQIIAELNEKLLQAQYDVDSELDEKQLQQYSNMCEAFEMLQKCEKIWFIPSQDSSTPLKSSSSILLGRRDGCIYGGIFNFMRSQFDIPSFEVSDGTIYLYPKFVILAKRPGFFEYVTYDSFCISSAYQRLDEEDIPSDAQILQNADNGTSNYDSKYLSKNLSTVVYGKLTIRFDNKIYTFIFSNNSSATKFAQSFSEFKVSLGFEKTDEDGNHNSDIEMKLSQIYPLAKECSYDLFNCLREMDKDERLNDVFSRIPMTDTSYVHDYSKDSRRNRIFPTLNNRLACCALLDAIKCHERLCKVDRIEYSPEATPLVILLTLVGYGNASIWSNIEHVNERQFDIAQGYYDVVKSNFTATDIGDRFYVIEMLRASGGFDGIIAQYAKMLYRFSMIIANAAGTINSTNEEWLSQLLSFTNLQSDKEYVNPTKKSHDQDLNEPDTVISSHKGDAINNLYSLIGLEAVKSEVQNIYNLIKIQKVRESKGLKSSDISYHCVFTGNPGTGKTTVARLVAQIYKDLGILSKGHLVETDRSGLVAEYVGQTAVKTNKIIDSALDGVLFIDEAYSLVQGGQNDYGLEAISTLLKRMEDDRNRLVVILAGYSDEMRQFIDANPGLQSRFNRYIHFEDYNVDDLVSIYGFNLKKYDYRISDDGVIKLREVLTAAVANKDKNFGNARFIRNLFEKTLENQARRLASISDLSEDLLTEIKAEDIPYGI